MLQIPGRSHYVLCFRNNQRSLVNKLFRSQLAQESHPPRDKKKMTTRSSGVPGVSVLQSSSHVQAPWAGLLLRPKSETSSDQSQKWQQNEEHILTSYISLLFHLIVSLCMRVKSLIKGPTHLPFIVEGKQSNDTCCPDSEIGLATSLSYTFLFVFQQCT